MPAYISVDELAFGYVERSYNHEFDFVLSDDKLDNPYVRECLVFPKFTFDKLILVSMVLVWTMSH